jgi:UDP-N-acetylglucosamine acyltransferase
LASHVVIKANTQMGPDNTVADGAVLGGRPQHLYAAERVGRLRIGRANMIRESVTIHCGLTEKDCTVVGDHNMIMVNAHIAHDCCIGNNTILTNNVMVAGHVTVEDRAYISGAVGIHQFCHVGQLAMVGGQAHINRDVPPFVTIDGLNSEVVGLNLVGLRRAGFTDRDVVQLKAAYRLIFRSGLTWREILAALQQQFTSGPAATYFPFLSRTTRGIMQERRGPAIAAIKLFRDDAGDQAADAAFSDANRPRSSTSMG